MTLEEIRASHTLEEIAEFRRRMAETTEEDIRRHMIEDGEDPDEVPDFRPPVTVTAVRARLGMSDGELAALLGVPLDMLRTWEQDRFTMEPAVRTLLRILLAEPEAALRALGRTAA